MGYAERKFVTLFECKMETTHVGVKDYMKCNQRNAYYVYNDYY